MPRAWLALACEAVIAAGASGARADNGPPSPAATTSAEAPATAPASPEGVTVECPRCHVGHWTSELYRPFVSFTTVAGYLYLKPRLSLGYGRPYSAWAGLDLTPMVTPDYVGGYSGLRLQVPWLELRAGARAVHAFTHQFLPAQTSYSLVDFNTDYGKASNYFDLEAEAAAAVPVGPGEVLVLATVSSIQLVPSGYDVYDEALHAIVTGGAPVYRGRLGYALRFLRERNLQVGAVGEVIDLPARGDQVYRAGLVATFDIDDHLQAVGLLVVPVRSPDSIGLAGADYTELGIRYRWATGHAHPPQETIPPEQESALALPR